VSTGQNTKFGKFAGFADEHPPLGHIGCSTMDEAQITPTLDVARRGQIATALADIQTVIVDGLRHGFFEYSIACVIVSGGKRQLLLRAGKFYKFTIPQDEVPR
jgi:hypothetical protein